VAKHQLDAENHELSIVIGLSRYIPVDLAKNLN
jgi:hypothetical protein